MWHPIRNWRLRRYKRAAAWATQMNDAINQLSQEQQDQLDAQLRERLGL